MKLNIIVVTAKGNYFLACDFCKAKKRGDYDATQPLSWLVSPNHPCITQQNFLTNNKWVPIVSLQLIRVNV